MSQTPIKKQPGAYKRFPTWRRLGAFLIDYVIVGLPLFVIAIGLFHATDGRVIPKLPIIYLQTAHESIVETEKTTDAKGREVINQVVVVKTLHLLLWPAYSIEYREITNTGDTERTYAETQTAIYNKEDGKVYPADVWFSDEIAFYLLFIYWIYFDASRWGASPGKRYLRMRITDYEGKRLTLSRSIARNLLKIPSIIVLMIGLIMIFFTKRKQGFHDLVAKTLVVDTGRVAGDGSSEP